MLRLMEAHAPQILHACRDAFDAISDDLVVNLLGDAFAEAPDISLDYAVAKKASDAACVWLDTPWSDLGSWDALWHVMTKDSAGNVVQGEGPVILQDTRNSFAFSDQPCVALVGVEDLVVVAMEDAVLVAAKDRAEQIRHVVDRLKGDGGALALEHNRVYRPWGWYQWLNRGRGYNVKCIMVKPGGKLSLQSHALRSEHWVVVTSMLEVTRGETTELLGQNQSTLHSDRREAPPGQSGRRSSLSD